jgi:hypothetical protein
MDFVSWDDDIPNTMGKIKLMFQTTKQIRQVQWDRFFAGSSPFLPFFWNICSSSCYTWTFEEGTTLGLPVRQRAHLFPT